MRISSCIYSVLVAGLLPGMVVAEQTSTSERVEAAILKVCHAESLIAEAERDSSEGITMSNVYAPFSHKYMVRAVYKFMKSQTGVMEVHRGYVALFFLSRYAGDALSPDLLLDDVIRMEGREQGEYPSPALISARQAYAVYGGDSSVEFFRTRCKPEFWSTLFQRQAEEAARLEREPEHEALIKLPKFPLDDPRLDMVRGLILCRSPGILQMLEETALQALESGDTHFGEQLQMKLGNQQSRLIASDIRFPAPTDQELKQRLRLSDEEWEWFIAYGREFENRPKGAESKPQASKIAGVPSESSLRNNGPTPVASGNWGNSSILILIVTCLAFLFVILRLRQKR